MWRVGDGKSISLKHDNWIPHSPTGVIYPICPLLEDQSVNFLFTEDGRSWDEAAVRTFFNDNDTTHILDISISVDGCADFASWPYTKFGIYTVRSAYNLARTLQFWSDQSRNGGGASSKHALIKKGWKKTMGCSVS